MDAFELCYWRRLLRVPWTARRPNQSILRGISPEYSLEGLMVKLNLQYFGHLMQRTDLFEKTLMLGKIEGRRRRGQQRMRWLDGITNSVEWVWVNSRSCWWTGRPGVLQSMGSQRVGHDWAAQLKWTELKKFREGPMSKSVYYYRTSEIYDSRTFRGKGWIFRSWALGLRIWTVKANVVCKTVTAIETIR